MSCRDALGLTSSTSCYVAVPTDSAGRTADVTAMTAASSFHRHSRTPMDPGFVTTVTVVTMVWHLSTFLTSCSRSPASSIHCTSIKGKRSTVTIVTVRHTTPKLP